MSCINLARFEILLEMGFIIIIIVVVVVVVVGLRTKRLVRSFNFRRRFSSRRATKLAFFLIVVLMSACKRRFHSFLAESSEKQELSLSRSTQFDCNFD